MQLVLLIAVVSVLVSVLLLLIAPRYHERRAERLLHRGRDRRAAHHLEAALRIWMRRRGADSLEVVSAQAGLARIRFLQGLAEGGRALLDRAVKGALGHSGKPSRRLVRTLIRVGRAAHAAERYDEAVAFGEKAALLAHGRLRSSDKDRGALEALLGDAYAGQGLFETAHEHYDLAMETYRLASSDDSPELGTVLTSVAAALAREERWREAREAGLEAIEILDQTRSARLPDALSVLADLDTRRGRLAEAEGLRLSICLLWERLAGSDSAVLAREYERRAELLQSMERPTEASYLLGKAERIRRAVVAA